MKRKTRFWLIVGELFLIVDGIAGIVWTFSLHRRVLATAGPTVSLRDIMKLFVVVLQPQNIGIYLAAFVFPFCLVFAIMLLSARRG